MIDPSESRWVRGSKPWVRRAMVAYSLSQAGVTLFNQGKQWYDQRINYQVSVASSDPVYEDLHAWLLDNTKTQSVKALAVASRIVPDEKPTTTVLYDGSRVQRLTVEGHRVAVQVITTDPFESGSSSEDSPIGWSMRRDRRRIVFTTPSTAGRDAVLRFIQERVVERAAKNRPPSLHVARSWGWDSSGELMKRPLSSVILKKGQMEDLREDVEFFLANEDAYARLGQPWHRGYLLQGPPGTGKSSLANALACHYGWSVYYLSLSDMRGDVDLINLVSSLPPRSMLLLEDVDVSHAATTREEGDEKGSTLSGLLNALDGVATPPGLITVMTTNYPERLDGALVRSGRVDKVVTISSLNNDQVRRMLATTGAHPSPDIIPLLRESAELSPAKLSDVLKAHIGKSEDETIQAVSELIEGVNLAAR